MPTRNLALHLLLLRLICIMQRAKCQLPIAKRSKKANTVVVQHRGGGRTGRCVKTTHIPRSLAMHRSMHGSDISDIYRVSTSQTRARVLSYQPGEDHLDVYDIIEDVRDEPVKHRIRNRPEETKRKIQAWSNLVPILLNPIAKLLATEPQIKKRRASCICQEEKQTERTYDLMCILGETTITITSCPEHLLPCAVEAGFFPSSALRPTQFFEVDLLHLYHQLWQKSGIAIRSFCEGISAFHISGTSASHRYPYRSKQKVSTVWHLGRHQIDIHLSTCRNSESNLDLP